MLRTSLLVGLLVLGTAGAQDRPASIALEADVITYFLPGYSGILLEMPCSRAFPIRWKCGASTTLFTRAGTGSGGASRPLRTLRVRSLVARARAAFG